MESKKIIISIIAVIAVILLVNNFSDLTGAATKAFPGWSYCRNKIGGCDGGEGDCDPNRGAVGPCYLEGAECASDQCKSGICITNVGDNLYGWHKDADVCKEVTVTPKDTPVTIPSAECKETGDTGKDLFKRGTVTDSRGTKTDDCQPKPGEDAEVIEYYCLGDRYRFTVLPCPSGYKCSGGKCVEKPREIKRCYDSDGGKDIYVKGTISGNVPIGLDPEDKCKDKDKNTLIETYCDDYTNEGTSTEYKCTYGCSNGACVRKTDVVTEITYKGQKLCYCSMQ